MPFFSIVMPVYNVKEYLQESIESVLSQNYHDFELIIVDDGSSDGSQDICDNYAKKYSENIRVIHQKNRGLLIARRNGYKRVTGNYVINLDSDDYLLEDAFEKIKKGIDKTNADLVFFEATETRKERKAYFNFPFSNYQTFSEKEKSKLYQYIFDGGLLHTMWNKAIKTDLIGIEKDFSQYQSVSFGEDVIQMFPIINAATKIIYLDEILYYYRPTDNSITSNFKLSYYDDLIKVAEIKEDYYHLWGATRQQLETLREPIMTLMLIAIRQSFSGKLSTQEILDRLRYIQRSEFFQEISSVKNLKVVGGGKIKRVEQIEISLLKHKIFFPFIIVAKVNKCRKRKFS